MQSGRILYAVHNGTYVLKLVGEVRVPMCASLDTFLEKMFLDHDLHAVLIDLTQTTAIDSTSLGLIAKISVFLQGKLKRKPVILSTNSDVNRILHSMGFEQVFVILETATANQGKLDELPSVEQSQNELTRNVIEAHRILMGLNEQNQETFKNLVDALEAEQQATDPANPCR